MIFDDETGDESLRSIGKMISDWITTGLLEINIGKVISAANVRDNIAYASVGATQQSFAEKTGAEVLIQGRYYKVENQVFVHAEIVDAYTGATIKSLETISGDQSNVMDIIDELTQKLLGYWATVGNNRYAKKPPKYEAFKLYLEAVDLWLENDQLGEAKLLEAYSLDSTYYTALLKLCILHGNNGEFKKSKELIELIEKKNPDFSDYERIRFDAIKASVEFRWEDEATAYERLTEFDGISTFMAGGANLDMNRPLRAIPYLETYIQKYNTDNETYYELRGEEEYLSSLYMSGQYDKMYEFVDSMNIEWKGSTGVAMHLYALAHKNQWERFDSLANAHEGKVLRGFSNLPAQLIVVQLFINEDHPKAEYYGAKWETEMDQLPKEIIFWRGYYQLLLKNYEQAIPDLIAGNLFGRTAACYYFIGSADKAKAYEQKQIDLIQAMEAQGAYVGWQYYDLACYYAATGEQDKAMDNLKKANATGATFESFSYAGDPTFKSLRGYPPFDEFIKPKG